MVRASESSTAELIANTWKVPANVPVAPEKSTSNPSIVKVRSFATLTAPVTSKLPGPLNVLTFSAALATVKLPTMSSVIICKNASDEPGRDSVPTVMLPEINVKPLPSATVTAPRLDDGALISATAAVALSTSVPALETVADWRSSAPLAVTVVPAPTMVTAPIESKSLTKVRLAETVTSCSRVKPSVVTDWALVVKARFGTSGVSANTVEPVKLTPLRNSRTPFGVLVLRKPRFAGNAATALPKASVTPASRTISLSVPVSVSAPLSSTTMADAHEKTTVLSRPEMAMDPMVTMEAVKW